MKSNRYPRMWVGLGLVCLLLLLSPAAMAEPAPIFEARSRFHPVVGQEGMVSSQHAEATRAGLSILQRGGNAVDGAVATGFALAVTLPRAGNLGGGGFMVAHLAASGRNVALDYREMAPARAFRDMFLDAQGDVDLERAHFSHRSAGVPGSVAGLVEALELHGTLPLAEVMAPAIRLAEEGFVVTYDLEIQLGSARERFERSPASMAIFFKPDGSPFRAGERLIQKDLAWSLRQIAAHGPAAFYGGVVGQRLVADMAANDGLVTLEDLRDYRVVERPPVSGTYRGNEVISMPPPSSGGVHLLQILNILEGFPLAELGHNRAETVHLMAEAMKLAYADRAEHLGDPDFWPVPTPGLISKTYAAKQRALIDPARARPASEIAAGDPAGYESPQTTHYSVVDRWGNAVATTTTLNFSYGSGIVAAGTGILLNNEMDDFSSKPGVPNAYGLIGGEANAIEPHKRPLSSMTPTIVLRDGKVFLVTGTPGGSRIITTTLQILLNVIDHGMNIAEATFAPRIHHQWLPDELRVESGFSLDSRQLLETRGHRLVEGDAMGGTQSILVRDGQLFGAADPRRPDGLALGY